MKKLGSKRDYTKDITLVKLDINKISINVSHSPPFDSEHLFWNNPWELHLGIPLDQNISSTEDGSCVVNLLYQLYAKTKTDRSCKRLTLEKEDIVRVLLGAEFKEPNIVHMEKPVSEEEWK